VLSGNLLHYGLWPSIALTVESVILIPDFAYLFSFAGVLNRCVFKFDHYCVWISNVVGGLNHRYFVALLISLCVMCVHGALATLNVFSAIVTVYNLWEVQYRDPNGIMQPMTLPTLARVSHLSFMTGSLVRFLLGTTLKRINFLTDLSVPF
jgi:hypothetical protein